MDTLDIAYVTSIILILIGGAVCIAIFGSREKNKRDRLGNSYRFKKKDGEIVRTKGKPSLFEPKGRYYYLEKAPFSADASVDGVKGADGKTYKAIAMFTLFIPDDTAQTAAESFFGLTPDEISDMVSEPLEAVLRTAVSDYSGGSDVKAFSDKFREDGSRAVSMFGVSIINVSALKIMEDASSGE